MTRPDALPGARFDDLGVGGQSFVLVDPVEVHCARTAADVVPTLRAAEAAARAGRWVAGFVSYEAAEGLEPRALVARWPSRHPLRSLPLAWFAAFAHRITTTSLAGVPADEAPSQWSLDRDEPWHRDAVERIRAEISEGSFYQVNLTARATGRIDDPVRLYRRVAARQRARFHALLDTGEFTVVSASPELFFRVDGDVIETRPMKGTAPRHSDPRKDRRRARALHTSPKERAENVMIVDLLRNDLAKVAVPGTVSVPRLLHVEGYPTVWQLTSTVTARLPDHGDLAALFTALFPCGSVTGAPKLAAMRAIARIEARPRGVYCGAIGLLEPGRRRRARFSVAIRTITIARSGFAEYGAGGGITYPSTPSAEWHELLAKTRIL